MSKSAGIGNGVGCTVWLDRSTSDAAITWDANATVSNILLKGGGGARGGPGYDGQQTINPGVVVTADEGIGMNGNCQLTVNLANDKSQLISAGGINTWTNFLFSGAGTVVLYTGQVTIGSNSIYVESFDTNVSIGADGVMTDQGQCSVNFGNVNNNLVFLIGDEGSFNLSSIPGGVTKLITSNSTGDYFDVNLGTFGYTGVGDGATYTIASAILVENGGVLSVNGGGNAQQDGSFLEFDGKYTDPNNANNWGSVYMTGGSVQLLGRCALRCTLNYFQTGGTLETMDNVGEGLWDETQQNIPGIMTITGGYVKIAQTQGQNQYGSLSIVCNVLEFSGTYAPKVNAAVSGQQDTLFIQGQLNIMNPGTSSLQVTVVGALQQANKGKQNWTIIQGASNALNQFAQNNDNTTGLTDKPNQPADGSYQVSW